MLEPQIHIALPVLNESENLRAFVDCLNKQQYRGFELVVCVNQYESCWELPDKKAVCYDNSKSIDFLRRIEDFPVRLINRSSRGKGWPEKKGGVGRARKIAMDIIAESASDNQLIVSMDADTFYPSDYLYCIVKLFDRSSKAYGVSLPYYHLLTKNNAVNRLVLRYELYMRYYALNMIRIRNPYRFTALGSAMAFPVWAYKKVGGLTPVLSGEDFYFLQKLVKTGSIAYTADTIAYPSARFSNRVNFGTGPALIKGAKGDWSSYPFYRPEFFDSVGETFALFSKLFYEDIATPMDEFLQKQFKTLAIWAPLRKNYKDRNNFIKACIGKVDGLRILQYLSQMQVYVQDRGEEILKSYFTTYHKINLSRKIQNILENLNFNTTSIDELNLLRKWMFGVERKYRK